MSIQYKDNQNVLKSSLLSSLILHIPYESGTFLFLLFQIESLATEAFILHITSAIINKFL